MEKNRQCTSAELGQVMDRYSLMVYRLAYSRLRNGADAEDISQEVFLRYYQKRPALDSEEHRRAWLLKVTLNRIRSLAGSAWLRHTVPLEEAMVFAQPEEQRLDEALAALPGKERVLLHLFYYEELSTREMANLLGRKESTVRTQLTRARRKLRTILKGEDGNESDILRHERAN